MLIFKSLRDWYYARINLNAIENPNMWQNSGTPISIYLGKQMAVRDTPLFLCRISTCLLQPNHVYGPKGREVQAAHKS